MRLRMGDDDYTALAKGIVVGLALLLAANLGLFEALIWGVSRAGRPVLVTATLGDPKTFNPITAPRAGKIGELLVNDAQPVEYGEPLFTLI